MDAERHPVSCAQPPRRRFRAPRRRSVPELAPLERLLRGELDTVTASMAKWWTTELQKKIVDQGVQMHGGYGYCKDFRVERLMRDAKITQIWEGTNQVHRQLIGRSFLQK